MNGAQKRTVAATPSFLDKSKAVANGSGIRASNGINSTHRPSQWHFDDSDASQEEEDNLLDEDDDANDSFYIPSKSFAQQLSSVDPSLYQGAGDDFCTEENFDQTSAYINHQLSVFGFSANLQFLNADKDTASRIKDAEYKEEMDLNWRRLSQDHDSALQTLSNTKARLERSDRENVELQAKLGAVEEELRVETEKHKHTREELRSSKANLQYTKTQYAHEARRKEKEMDVLKEKIQRSISRGQSSSGSGPTVIPGGITVLNPVSRSLFGKQHVSDSEQLLKEVIEQQKAKEMEIVQENDQLRRTLYTVHVELEGLIRKKSASKYQAANPYGLPFEIVKEKIETEIQDALTLLSDQWTHRPQEEPTTSPTEIVIRDQRIEELERDIEKMQHELEDSTVLIQGAQKMIDNLNGGNFLAGAQDFKLSSEGSDMTAQEVEEAETKLRKQREDLAKERKKFTEACLDLGRQREELKKSKLEFEESKRTFRLDKVIRKTDTGALTANIALFITFLGTTPMTTTPLPSFGPKLNVSGQGSTKMSATTVEDSVEGEEEQEEGEETQQTPEDGQDGDVHDTHDHDKEIEPANREEEEEEEEEEEVLLRTPSRPRTSYLSTMPGLGTSSKVQQKPGYFQTHGDNRSAFPWTDEVVLVFVVIVNVIQAISTFYVHCQDTHELRSYSIVRFHNSNEDSSQNFVNTAIQGACVELKAIHALVLHTVNLNFIDIYKGYIFRDIFREGPDDNTLLIHVSVLEANHCVVQQQREWRWWFNVVVSIRSGRRHRFSVAAEPKPTRVQEADNDSDNGAQESVK
ncbi:hypothetical protein BGZ82_006347 [Podila clonocystis]|nr:hypothetical protein BGZ82_006347 [Podila clonocystis]